MWFTFFLSGILCTALLYIPGFLMMFNAGGLLICLSISPMLSLLMYSLIAIALSIVRLPATPVLILTIACIISLTVFLITKISCRHFSKNDGSFRASTETDVKVILLYALAGVIITAYVYVKCMNGPDSFIQTYDNVFHLSRVRSLMDSTDWSPLHSSLYPISYDSNIDSLPGVSYYPSAWHILCALVGLMSNATATFATNVVNSVFAGIVFPLSISALICQIFGHKREIIIFGAAVVLGFVSFPWVLLILWPLFPNMTSLAILPAFIAVFIQLFSPGLNFYRRAYYGLAFIFSIVGYVFVQPNSVFSAAVFLISFCAYKIWSYFDGSEMTSNKTTNIRSARNKRLIPTIFFLVFVILVWTCCYFLPFLQPTISYYWPPLGSASQEIFNVLTLAFAGSNPQPFLATLVFLGCIYCCIHLKYSWLFISYAFSALIYFVSATSGDTTLKHFLAGFWYTDPYRTAATAAVFAIPLAALGLCVLSKLLFSLARELGYSDGQKKNLIFNLLIACFTMLIIFFPSHNSLEGRVAITPFGNIREASRVQNDGSDSNAFDDEELEFVQKVDSIISDDDLVINMPYDGSLYAYGYDGINIYYRSISGYGAKGETRESSIIREGLCAYANNPDVQAAIKAIGADYVLTLENDTERMDMFFPTFEESEWAGLLGLTPETPGFELVLADGDMRLYRIIPLD